MSSTGRSFVERSNLRRYGSHGVWRVCHIERFYLLTLKTLQQIEQQFEARLAMQIDYFVVARKSYRANYTTFHTPLPLILMSRLNSGRLWG